MRRSRYRTKLGVSIAALLVVAATGCEPPQLTALEPNSGPPATVVEVDGTDVSFSSVIWDVGGAERTLDSSFLSARFFSVPSDATPGTYAVQLENDAGRSTTMNFTVTDGTVRPAPRIDDITVAGFRMILGTANMVLMVHGANFDVGATLEVTHIPRPTEFSRLLRNDSLNATDPSTLGYPIFHYGTLWAPVNGLTPGSLLTNIVVVNEDGTRSEPASYRIAASLDELDSDGDGLPDDWERNGYDADGDGTIDVDLPALGADPQRKDMFIEVDWMDEATPNSGIWANIEDTFANAPILNTDGSQGITVHLDRGAGFGGGGGDSIPYADFIRYDDNSWSDGTYVNFFDIKEDNFDEDREDIFRYAVFGWDQGHHPGSSGRAADIPARDFFVSLASWGADGDREDYQTATFLHELGHALGLFHGGDGNSKTKDNYNSIMQYGNGWVLEMGEYVTWGPSQFGGIDTDCDLMNIDGVFTFSQGQRADLDENDLDENVGVCDNVAIEWDFDGTIESSVSRNVDGITGLEVISDYPDWANIMLALP